jgi:hypothetical protein
MTTMAQDFETARMLYPHLSAPALVEGIAFAAKNGASLQEYAVKVAREAEQLNKLEHALGMAEIAQMLLDLAGPEAIGTALSRIQEKNEGTLSAAMNKVEMTTTEKDESEMDLELEDQLIVAYENEDTEAIGEVLEKIKHKRMIRLNANPTVVGDTRTSDGRHRINKNHRSFEEIVRKSTSEFNKFANLNKEDLRDLSDQDFQVLAEEAYNSDTSEHFISEAHVDRIRALIIQKKSDERDAAAAEDADRQNSKAKTMAKVRGRMTQNEGTAAADTIRAHGEPTIRVGDIDTRSALTGTDFDPRIDNSFVAIAKRNSTAAGRLKNPTGAAKTIARSSKIDFKSNVDNDKGSQPYNQTYVQAADAASKMSGLDSYTPAGQKKASQKQYQANLDSLTSPRPDGT